MLEAGDRIAPHTPARQWSANISARLQYGAYSVVDGGQHLSRRTGFPGGWLSAPLPVNTSGSVRPPRVKEDYLERLIHRTVGPVIPSGLQSLDGKHETRLSHATPDEIEASHTDSL